MEENILFVRTFLILGGMLILTTIAARLNKAFETRLEFAFTVFGQFLFLVIIYVNADKFPSNIISCALFSFFIGWSLGPTISYIGEGFKFRKYLKSKGIRTKSIKKEKSWWGAEEEKKTVYYYHSDPKDLFDAKSDVIQNLRSDFEKNILPHDRYSQEWQNIVFQTLMGITMAIILTAGINYLTDIDFGSLGPVLFILLISLIVIGISNAYVFKSSRRRLLQSYFGVCLFTFYLIYDFNRLEKAIASGDTSWAVAVDIAVNIYLDIINLFIRLLEILAD